MNALSTAWGLADLAGAATSGADGVLLPKVESADTVPSAIEVLETHEAPPALGLWCMLETPLGILNAAAIATAGPRVTALVMGTSDLTTELHARHTRERPASRRWTASIWISTTTRASRRPAIRPPISASTARRSSTRSRSRRRSRPSRG